MFESLRSLGVLWIHFVPSSHLDSLRILSEFQVQFVSFRSPPHAVKSPKRFFHDSFPKVVIDVLLPFGFLDLALFGCYLVFFRHYPFKPRFFRTCALHLRGFRRLLRLVGPTVVVSRDAESSCFHESLQLSAVHPCISVAGNGSFPEVCAVHPLIPQLVSSCFHDLVCCGEATALLSGSVPYIPLSLERATARRLMR